MHTARRAPTSPLALMLAACVFLSACAGLGGNDDRSIAQRMDSLMPADIIVLGERHDAPEHHTIARESVEALVAKQQLAALALEMAEEGRTTDKLSTGATEAQVQAALGWDAKAWPWDDYGPAVMAAVRAGVPVVGANLPGARMRNAMADVSLDAQLSDEARTAQQAAVRDGHCNLLPEAQIVPMTRIQIARDRAMALTLAQLPRGSGQAVLLITGAGHAVRSRGVPQHLPTDLKVRSVRLKAADGADGKGSGDFDRTWRTPPLPPKDHCAELRARPR